MTDQVRRRIASEAAFAVPIALAVMLITFVLAGVAVAVAIDTNAFSNRDTNSKVALEAADAGVRQALYRLNMYKPDGSSCPTVPATAVGAGAPAATLCAPQSGTLANGATYTYWVSQQLKFGDSCAGTTVASTSSDVAQRCVTAIGTLRNVSARVQQRVDAFTATPTFQTAIFGTASVTISDNATIVSDTQSSPALLGTNGVLTVGGQGGGTTTIDGYQLPPGASVQLGNNVVNNGPTTPNSAPYPIPAANDGGSTTQNTAGNLGGSPAFDNAGTYQAGTCSQQEAQSAFHWSGTTWVQTNCNYRILCPTAQDCDTGTGTIDFDPNARTLYLGNKATLALGGGVYNFCSLYLSNNARITINNGPTQIYIDSPPPSDPNSGAPPNPPSGSATNPACSSGASDKGIPAGTFTMNQNSTINAGGSALNAQIYVYGDTFNTPPQNTVNLNNNADSSFSLYAPRSKVILNPSNNTIFRGAITGYSVTIGNASHFTYEADVAPLSQGFLHVFYRSFWEQCPALNFSASAPTSGC